MINTLQVAAEIASYCNVLASGTEENNFLTTNLIPFHNPVFGAKFFNNSAFAHSVHLTLCGDSPFGA